MNKQVAISDILWGESPKSMTLAKFTAVCEGYAEKGRCKKSSKDEVEKLYNKLTGKKTESKNTKN